MSIDVLKDFKVGITSPILLVRVQTGSNYDDFFMPFVNRCFNEEVKIK